jgi:hypothetical protein
MYKDLGFDSRQERQTFHFLHNFQADFGAHPASYPMGAGVVKRQRLKSDHKKAKTLSIPD